jgi:ATP synthase I chain
VLIDEHFSERILTRIWMVSAVLCLLAALWMWVHMDVFHAASFLLGGVVAILNLRWLEYSVRRMLDADAGRAKARRLWPKMVARYAFLGAIAYVIFKGYLLSVSAFLAGLFVPVAALMLEAVYELVAALRS